MRSDFLLRIFWILRFYSSKKKPNSQYPNPEAICMINTSDIFCNWIDCLGS